MTAGNLRSRLFRGSNFKKKDATELLNVNADSAAAALAAPLWARTSSLS